MSDVRVRFCPSPTGTPHVGLIRTALFNWAYARHTGGKLVFRIEDTDAARDSEESYQAIIDALTWLGLDWDEGIDVGGPHGPYRQSQRKDIYADVLAKLIESGEAYESFSSPEETEARHRAAGRDPKLGYDNHDRDLTDEEKAAFREAGRKPVIRLRMPDEDIAFDDLVRGRVEFKAGVVSDFVIARSTGEPLYTLVNPVDDALMEITHVLRGEDLLPSTPRQIALYRALERIGVGNGAPHFGHLPFVMGEGNKKLSKRDPESDLFIHRRNGFLPEGLLNYLALLGWSISADNEVFTMDEMVAAFDVADVNSNPARFDQKKADAINAEHIRRLAPEDFAARLRTYLAETRDWPIDYPAKDFAFLAEMVQTRIKTLGEAWDLVKFLVVSDDEFQLDEKSARRNLKEDAVAALDATITAVEGLREEEFTTPAIEAALQKALIE
ncbi:MAG TPA: glutamate--tRNA ligase, partial [Corynebacterium sp.]|uniref:glutamate--tRNA ligase n=1 Tax=Corynebacterium sp. TaxID=1720 RepID=UPI0017A6C69B